jgi:hypothetical protein
LSSYTEERESVKPTVQINMRMDLEFYEAMEKARGEKSRTAFIRDAVAAHMKYDGELPVARPKKMPVESAVKKKAGGGLPKIPDPTPEILDTLKAQTGLTTAAEIKDRVMCPNPTCAWRGGATAKNCPKCSRSSMPYDAEAFAKREFS